MGVKASNGAEAEIIFELSGGFFKFVSALVRLQTAEVRPSHGAVHGGPGKKSLNLLVGISLHLWRLQSRMGKEPL